MTKYEDIADLVIGHWSRQLEQRADNKDFIRSITEGFRKYIGCPEERFHRRNVDKNRFIMRDDNRGLEPVTYHDGFDYAAVEFRLEKPGTNLYVEAWFLLGVRKEPTKSWTIRLSFADENKQHDMKTGPGDDALYDWMFQKIIHDFRHPGKESRRIGFGM